jgi:hypothetical protein
MVLIDEDYEIYFSRIIIEKLIGFSISQVINMRFYKYILNALL